MYSKIPRRVATCFFVVAKLLIVLLSLGIASLCFFAAQTLAAWEWSLIDFPSTFYRNFPSFLFGLTNGNAPPELRGASMLLILSIIEGIAGLFSFQAKSIITPAILLITTIIAYGIFISVSAMLIEEATIIFGVFSVTTLVLYAVKNYLKKK